MYRYKGTDGKTVIILSHQLKYSLVLNVLSKIIIIFQAEEVPAIADNTGNHIPREPSKNLRKKKGSTDPPESQFKNLRPSDSRYSLLRDEF